MSYIHSFDTQDSRIYKEYEKGNISLKAFNHYAGSVYYPVKWLSSKVLEELIFSLGNNYLVKVDRVSCWHCPEDIFFFDNSLCGSWIVYNKANYWSSFIFSKGGKRFKKLLKEKKNASLVHSILSNK